MRVNCEQETLIMSCIKDLLILLLEYSKKPSGLNISLEIISIINHLLLKIQLLKPKHYINLEKVENYIFSIISKLNCYYNESKKNNLENDDILLYNNQKLLIISTLGRLKISKRLNKLESNKSLNIEYYEELFTILNSSLFKILHRDNYEMFYKYKILINEFIRHDDDISKILNERKSYLLEEM